MTLGQGVTSPRVGLLVCKAVVAGRGHLLADTCGVSAPAQALHSQVGWNAAFTAPQPAQAPPALLRGPPSTSPSQFLVWGCFLGPEGQCRCPTPLGPGATCPLPHVVPHVSGPPSMPWSAPLEWGPTSQATSAMLLVPAKEVSEFTALWKYPMNTLVLNLEG